MEKISGYKTGCYQLIMHLSEDSRFDIGRRKKLPFPAGFYVYTGSHQKSLDKRLARHVKRQKKMHWHIDYLTTRPAIAIREILIYPGSRAECRINREFMAFSGGEVLQPNFGNGDCRHHCDSHLIYLPELPEKLLSGWTAQFSDSPVVRKSPE